MASLCACSLESKRPTKRSAQTLIDRIARALGKNLAGKVICVWGLAFKPNTDDMRAAPSIALIEEALLRGSTVVAYEPVAKASAARALGAHERLRFAPSASAAAEGADALVIVTEWKEFRSPDLDFLRRTLRRRQLIDGRNVIDPIEAGAAGIECSGSGRP